MKHELIISLICVLLFGACNKDNFEERLPDLPTEPIIVLYENDVHCAVDVYPMLVSLRNDCLSRTDYVSTVSCSDFASGGFVGAISQGQQVVEIMNYVGYDVVALGNHELDYGVPQMFHLTEALDFTRFYRIAKCVTRRIGLDLCQMFRHRLTS